MSSPYKTSAYRYPSERLILYVTILLVLLVIALTATATVCTSIIFIAVAIALSYYYGRSKHLDLVRNSREITPKKSPRVASLVNLAANRLQADDFEVYITQSKTMNAYTFGLSKPKVVVLFSALFEVMDAEELLFVLGHETGHIQLGHTLLNSLVGGMAGIPSPTSASALLSMAFLWWNRVCEYSADRAGLLACGKPEKAISALIKLEAGPEALTPLGMKQAYKRIDAEDDTILGDLSEVLGSHPLLIKRINKLRKFASSSGYRRLQTLVIKNDNI